MNLKTPYSSKSKSRRYPSSASTPPFPKKIPRSYSPQLKPLCPLGYTIKSKHLSSSHLRNSRFILALIACIFSANVALATIFNLGPSHPFATPSNVAWESLAASDAVRVHWKADAYRDKWVICRQGLGPQPITVNGVPGPNGERPVTDGNGAMARLVLNYWTKNGVNR